MSYNDGVNAIVKLHPETILTTMILNKLIIMKCLNQHLHIDLDRLPPSTQWSKVILLTRSTKRCLTTFSDQPGLLVRIWIFFSPVKNPVKSIGVKIGIRICEILKKCNVMKVKKVTVTDKRGVDPSDNEVKYPPGD